MKVKDLIIRMGLFLSLLCSAGCQEDKPLRIESTYPDDGARGVAMDSYVVVQILFSKPMNRESTSRALLVYPKEPYEISWGSKDKSMRISYLSFPASTYYTITVGTEAEAKDGEKLPQDYTFSFEIEADWLIRADPCSKENKELFSCILNNNIFKTTG